MGEAVTAVATRSLPRPPPSDAAGAAAGPARHEPPGAPVSARKRLLLYGAIALLALTLGTARLVSGPWFHVYNPREVSLIEGWPVAWEAVYYTDHLPTFASRARPEFGISPVHYRTLLPLFLAAQLYAWSASAYWSFAAVDLLFWCLAGIAGFHLALRLGASPWGAALGGLLLTASPVLASHMWRHDLHVADFAGLPIALWAATVLVDEPRPRWQLAAALALLLLLLSLSYQYQWLVAPLAFVLCATQPRIGWRSGALVTGGAILGYLALTAASEALFRSAVGPPTAWTGAVVSPARALLGPLAEARSLADAFAAGRALLPGREQLGAVVGAYHPLVFGAGVAGAVILGRRMVALLGTGLAVSLASHMVYAAPWTAALCYPLIAVGAGTACAAAGAAAARRAGRPAWLRYGVGLTLAAACAVATNLDLAGISAFALDWWRSYADMRSRF